jgi:NAD(P)-dependent dehydrogenase (short-subunit alcohol dehydrogenase family)
MKTLVITGGTDGMGKALALTYLQRGDAVIVVGRNREKWQALKATVAGLGASERAHFIEADLSRLADAKRAIALIEAKCFALDAIVLCARHYSSTRVVSEEGFESNFATFYLSRFLFSHELLGPLENAPQPIIMNVAGPGAPSGRIHWDDFGLANDYSGDEALEQGGKLCDSLGVAFAEVHGNVKTRYVLLHPGLVSTNFSGTYDQTVAAQIAQM